MAEPQPSTITEGASDPHAPTSTAEDRKAAAALESLDTVEDSNNNGGDSKALDKAMKGLSVQEDKKSTGEEKTKKKIVVKVDAADIALLVSELEVPKQKATELLRANGGDAVKALGAYVGAAVVA
ncbi:hypothetical protein N0V83_002713 [Neocucurbitaria cava]|uniref:Nascent polypeptide-associated complex subunit alpha-like UBA domain-containing protein n=1 Tax=Neocucurbitaria cava TaxID=798079 RepID=A0A9W8YCN7_9PLEO|nr:hypothetical protein N0V83_002713 [Neocucurbitaria cava]